MKEIKNNPNFLEDFICMTISKIEDLLKTNTIIGDPIITPSGNIIIPINKVSVGYVVGGGEYNSANKKLPFPTCGGSGGGASITPVGFIVEINDDIKFVGIENKTAYQTIINFLNTIMSKIRVKNEKEE